MSNEIPKLSNDPTLKTNVENFLYIEAEHLDERRFEEWLKLFSDSVTYRMPIRRNVLPNDEGLAIGGDDDVAHVDDDKEYLQARIKRIRSGLAWSEQPPARTRRLVSNVRIYTDEGQDHLDVRSNFICYFDQHDGESTIYAGEHRDTLVARGDTFIIEKRVVLLDQSVLSMNLSIFL